MIAVSGEFIACEGSGLFRLQSACLFRFLFIRFLFIFAFFWIFSTSALQATTAAAPTRRSSFRTTTSHCMWWPCATSSQERRSASATWRSACFPVRKTTATNISGLFAIQSVSSLLLACRDNYLFEFFFGYYLDRILFRFNVFFPLPRVWGLRAGFVSSNFIFLNFPPCSDFPANLASLLSKNMFCEFISARFIYLYVCFGSFLPFFHFTICDFMTLRSFCRHLPRRRPS